MRKRKLSSLAVFLTTIAASLFIPISVNAATNDSLDDGPVAYDDHSAGCTSGNCTHTVTGTGTDTNKNTIQISGEGISLDDPNKITHTVILDTVNITAGEGLPAIQIFNKAKVHIKLRGTSTLQGATSHAGIFVESGSSLTISSEDGSDNNTLNVTGGEGGAGIGGESQSSPGDIIINSGTINATGGKTAAGIGCGREGRCGKIEIKGGKINAEGGESGDIIIFPPDDRKYFNGGSGIGYGGGSNHLYPPDSQTEVILSGGTINAVGGVDSNGLNGKAFGLDCPVLSSNEGSADIITTIAGPTNKSKFNGIVWDRSDNPIPSINNPRIGTIYGNAELKNDLQYGEFLVFQNDSDRTCSLTVPEKKDGGTIKIAGSIRGNASHSIVGKYELNASTYYIDPEIDIKAIPIRSDYVQPQDLVYTGNNQTEKALELKWPDKKRPVDTDRTVTVVTNDWDYTLSYKNDVSGTTPESILNAGDYVVKFSNSKYPNSGFEFDIHVERAQVTDEMIGSIEPVSYTGKKREPSFTVTFNNNSLSTDEIRKEFEVNYTNNTDVTTEATVTVAGKNINFKGSASSKFAIERASIDSAKITVPEDSTTSIYDGKTHKPEITVHLDVTYDDNTTETLELKPNTDYTIIPSRDGEETDDFISAGTVIYTIEGTGNYVDTAGTVPYNITPRPVTINERKPVTATDRDYDSTREVKLNGVELRNVLDADRNDVKLETGLISSPDVNIEPGYSEVTFTDVKLSGDKAKNYILDADKLTLSTPVKIRKVSPEKFKPTYKDPYDVNESQTAFICTVEINNQKGIDYEFSMDDTGVWVQGTANAETKKTTYTFPDEIAPESTHTFHVRSVGTNNVEQVDMDDLEVEFKKLPNPNKAPESCELAFTANSDGRTFTATITPAGLEGAQYCIKPTDADDSQLITLDSNTYANCAPLTSYTAYIRYPGNDVYEPSEAATATAETEKAPLADAKPQYTPVLTRINASNPTDEYMTSDLRSMYGTMSDVLSDMAKRLSEDYPDIYSHDRIEYYELNLMVQRYNPDGTLSEPTPATEDDFKQADGSFGSITVQLKASDLPSGTNPNRNTYAIAHMFATPIGSHFAGDIETSPGTPGGGGITFDVNGTSPIAIAYSAANNSEDPGNEDPGNDPGNEDPGNEDPGTEDPGTDPGTEDPGNDPNGDNNNNGNTDNNGNNGNTDNNGNTGNNGDTGTTGGTDGNGTNGGTGTTGGTDGNGTNGGTGTTGTGGNSAVDALKSAAASLLPKTGDTSKIIVWVIAAIAACIAVVAVIRNNSKKGKAATAAASGGKATASTKKTAATAAKKSTTTAAKKTTTSTKKTTAAATKKTTTTKKGR